MIQAIVFLPLIGALIAGAIALFGAHARHPSGDQVEHDEHGEHGHDAHAPLVVHTSYDQDPQVHALGPDDRGHHVHPVEVLRPSDRAPRN